MTMDDGCHLVSTIHTTRTELLPDIIGGMEETTTGVIRLKSMEKQGVLRFPVLAVNDSDTKHMFDNRYGTGQSSLMLLYAQPIFSSLAAHSSFSVMAGVAVVSPLAPMVWVPMSSSAKLILRRHWK